MRGINTLQVGSRRSFDSPVTITIEWIFEQFRRLRKAWRRFTARLVAAPRASRRNRGHRLVGASSLRRSCDGPPIHNLHLEFWGRTFWFAWRKIAAGRTDADGASRCHFLSAPLATSHSNSEPRIQKTTRVYFQEDDPHFHFDLFKAIPVVKSDLIAWTITCAQSRWTTGSTIGALRRRARSSTTHIPTCPKLTPLAAKMR